MPGLAAAAVQRLILGDKVEARALAAEALVLVRAHIDMAVTANQLIFVAGQMGLRDEYLAIVQQAPEGPWKDLTVAGAKGDLRSAGDLYATFGASSLEALARLFGGEELIEAGRRAEGEAELEKALEFYRSVGATFFVQRGEALLADAQSASA